MNRSLQNIKKMAFLYSHHSLRVLAARGKYWKWLQTKQSATTLAFTIALFLTLSSNISFWKALLEVLDHSHAGKIGLIVAVFVILTAVFNLFLSLAGFKYLFKPWAILILMIAAISSYFIDSYGVLIDTSMIQNIVETDLNEASELIGAKLFSHVFFLGLLPSIFIYSIDIQYKPFLKTLFHKAILLFLTVAIIGLTIFSQYKNFSFLTRNNRHLRLLINPSYPIYAALKYMKSPLSPEPLHAKTITENATQAESWKARGKKSIVVLVVGETARAQNFSLNGYQRATNPLLSQEAIINFKQVYSCGTETIVSVPCMFSHLNRETYSNSEAKTHENLLDVLSHAGIEVLWRDNNSGCKGVCERVRTENMSGLKVPDLCNPEECFDEVLLYKLEEYFAKTQNDTLIVLHQKGSHGPSYYKRYPDSFKFFEPACVTKQIQDCTEQEIINAYDNTIRYTDYFLSQVIQLLRKNSEKYHTAMLYLSDHGESLGEKGIYLHGLPYFIAPDGQKHIPFMLWLSEGYATQFGIDPTCMKKSVDFKFSHDNLFHSILGMLQINTDVYQTEHDIFAPCHRSRDMSNQSTNSLHASPS